MEFEIEVKLKISIKDHETNVNEITRAIKEGVKEVGRGVLKKVLMVYQLRIREALLADAQEIKGFVGGDGGKGG